MPFITVSDTAKAAKSIYKNVDFEGYSYWAASSTKIPTGLAGKKRATPEVHPPGLQVQWPQGHVYPELPGSSNSPFTKGDGRKDWTVATRL